ncbi:hypothetical protein C8R45DRAFT_1138855 [Mycena sanguinolenta]|nr:hypothetical protein C8R45DRAFT_1138855 [Mycena sanguinolenta]
MVAERKVVVHSSQANIGAAVVVSEKSDPSRFTIRQHYLPNVWHAVDLGKCHYPVGTCDPHSSRCQQASATASLRYPSAIGGKAKRQLGAVSSLKSGSDVDCARCPRAQCPPQRRLAPAADELAPSRLPMTVHRSSLLPSGYVLTRGTSLPLPRLFRIDACPIRVIKSDVREDTGGTKLDGRPTGQAVRRTSMTVARSPPPSVPPRHVADLILCPLHPLHALGSSRTSACWPWHFACLSAGAYTTPLKRDATRRSAFPVLRLGLSTHSVLRTNAIKDAKGHGVQLKAGGLAFARRLLPFSCAT